MRLKGWQLKEGCKAKDKIADEVLKCVAAFKLKEIKVITASMFIIFSLFFFFLQFRPGELVEIFL